MNSQMLRTRSTGEPWAAIAVWLVCCVLLLVGAVAHGSGRGNGWH